MNVRPSIVLRMSLWSEGAGTRETIGLTLTPQSDTAPWRKEYWYSAGAADAVGPQRRPATALPR